MPRHVETRKNVYSAIDSERTHQDKWDTCESEGNYTILEFAVYMQDYLADIIHKESRNAREHVKEDGLHIMRKVTALGVSCMEQHGARPRK